MSNVTGDYRQYMDKNYFGSWDIEGAELDVTIDHAEKNDVQNDRGTEKKLVVHLKGGYKPLIVNATNGESISKVAGSTKVENWKGVKITLYKEHGKWFGKEADAVRVRPYAPKEDYICEACGKAITSANGKPPKWIAQYTKEQYQMQLCASCAAKLKKGANDATDE